MPKPMYVWSGSAWVSVASEVESLAGYATQSYADNTPGMKMIVPTSVAVGSGSGSIATQGTVSFSSASSISLNSCFSSTYDSYKIMFNVTSASANNYPILRLRASGTDNSSSNYNFGIIERNTTNTTVTGYTGSSSTSFQLGYCLTAGASNTVDLFSPFATDYTSYLMTGTTKNATVSSANYGEWKNGGTSVTTSYDGFSIIAGSGTLTGTIRIYGYKAG
jgi:hypothetical protein